MTGKILIAAIGLLHIYILIVEMFLWNKKTGMRMFHIDREFADKTRVLAANQGLYNGFLAAGLLLSLAFSVTPGIYFFLCCVMAAGVFGAFTAGRRILYVQALPALAAVILFSLKI